MDAPHTTPTTAAATTTPARRDHAQLPRGPTTPFPHVSGWWGDLLRWAFSGEAEGPAQQVLAFITRWSIVLAGLIAVELIVALTWVATMWILTPPSGVAEVLRGMLDWLMAHTKIVASANLVIGGGLAATMVLSRKGK